MDGDRRAGAWEKRGRRREKRGWKAGVPRWRELAEIEKISQHFVLFQNRNGTKRKKPLRKGAGSGSESCRKKEKKMWEEGVLDPLPPVPGMG